MGDDDGLSPVEPLPQGVGESAHGQARRYGDMTAASGLFTHADTLTIQWVSVGHLRTKGVRVGRISTAAPAGGACTVERGPM